MENVAHQGNGTTAYYEDAHDTEGERHHYTWLEDYRQRLGGKDAHREFQERYYGKPEYHTRVASLAAYSGLHCY